MTEPLNAYPLMRQQMKEWRRWVGPLVMHGKWYTKDYTKEVIEVLQKAEDSLPISIMIFEMVPDE